jgi:hypothetical protein
MTRGRIGDGRWRLQFRHGAFRSLLKICRLCNWHLHGISEVFVEAGRGDAETFSLRLIRYLALQPSSGQRAVYCSAQGCEKLKATVEVLDAAESKRWKHWWKHTEAQHQKESSDLADFS